MVYTSPFFSLLFRVFQILPFMAVNIVTKRQRLMNESEVNVISTKLRRLTGKPEFDVIAVDTDDEQLQLLLCSEKLSSAYVDFVDDDVMPIQTVIPEGNKDTSNDVTVGGTGSTIMVAGSYYIPKLNDEKPLGEDASFICAKEETIGVADGVGGWAKKGIDSGVYSRELMKNAESAVKKRNPSSTSDLMKVLNEAFWNTKAQGSSTACILSLSNDILHAVNVGDSRFVVIRGGIIVYKSEIQQSRFNCPFQLGSASKSDDPSVAEKISVPVVAGDVIVLGTDGLFDNVHDFELETIVNSLDEPGTLAWRIAQCALDNSKSTELYTPFTRECWRAGMVRNGGKYDDITVIVANIWPL